MHKAVSSERMLTELDFQRLSKLVDAHGPSSLADVLATAEVTPSRAVPPGVVTMYSRVELVDCITRKRQVLTLCYPRDAQPAEGSISVLSPVGSSLLGLKAGDVARWRAPHGQESAATVVGVLHQPEAAGDHLT